MQWCALLALALHVPRRALALYSVRRRALALHAARRNPRLMPREPRPLFAFLAHQIRAELDDWTGWSAGVAEFKRFMSKASRCPTTCAA